MNDITYTITLSDGTQIENLRLNGNNFISDEEITDSMFENNLSPVIISDGENEETHSQMSLIHITLRNNEYWFTLADLTSSEILLNRVSNLESAVGDVGSVLNNMFTEEE